MFVNQAVAAAGSSTLRASGLFAMGADGEKAIGLKRLSGTVVKLTLFGEKGELL
ncbi:MAG TPA: hypothetical protein VJP60_03485 [Rhizomicrobium sp.]|nr:hypothetical protein [Rhizomicrobium sp.]